MAELGHAHQASGAVAGGRTRAGRNGPHAPHERTQARLEGERVQSVSQLEMGRPLLLAYDSIRPPFRGDKPDTDPAYLRARSEGIRHISPWEAFCQGLPQDSRSGDSLIDPGDERKSDDLRPNQLAPALHCGLRPEVPVAKPGAQ